MTPLLDQVQRTLGSTYTVERELGGGGMSRVFVALDSGLGRRVVVKVLPPELAASVSIDRFRREIMLAAGLQHPHIVGVLSAGEADGLPFFMMPFVEGESLRTRLERGRLPIAEAVRILRDVARALAYAHERGVVHRDIKPDNVLLTSGSAVVADFGVAKALSSARQQTSISDGTLTLVGTSLGTPTYMAPEQAAGDPTTDHRADIYAFGIMAYEMLAGVPPFRGLSPRQLLAAQLAQDPEPLATHRADIPVALENLVSRCLKKEPDDRPQTAAEIVTVLEDPAVVSGAFTSLPSIDGAALGGRGSRWRLGVAAIVAIALVGAGVLLGRPDEAQRAQLAATSAVSGPPAKSIAVLPLVNIGRDSTDAYFATGMTDEITSALARIPGLRVASRTAAGALQRTDGVEAIGKALNVATLLEGTVQRDGGRFRVTTRLVNAADGFMLWSDVYESDLTDVFAVQDAITTAIIAALGEQFGDADAVDSTTVAEGRGTSNTEAYNAYLRGRWFFARRGEESLRKAIGLFAQAVDADPEYAMAYTGLADAYAVLPLYSGGAGSDSLLERALVNAERAIALDSSLAEAHASRGNILAAMWRWAEAEQELVHAIALRPDYATAHQWLGETRLLNGRVDEAVASLRRASELDPVSPIMLGSLALAFGIAGSVDSALARGRQAVDLDPSLFVTRYMMGTTALYVGRRVDALRELEIASQLSEGLPEVRGMLGYAYVMAGDTARAREILLGLERLGARAATTVPIARISLALGDTAKALTHLERAVAQRSPFFASESMASPIFDRLRGSARFQAILRAVGLDADRLRQSARR